MKNGNTSLVKKTDFFQILFRPQGPRNSRFISFFHVRGDMMAVNVKKLQEQLLSRIVTDDLVEVEKVTRFISLVK